MASEAEIAQDFVASFINKKLRVHIQDGRMFVGHLKCTDNERNLIISTTYEYRVPADFEDFAAAGRMQHTASGAASSRSDMNERYVGLVVIPGQYITKIEVQG